MNKTVKHILAGLLAVLGFSSCSSLREAREARAERERQAFEAQQRALVEETLQEMLERDASDPELQARKALEAREKAQEMERVRIEQEERVKLLYAVPNAPYREIKSKNKVERSAARKGGKSGQDRASRCGKRRWG